MDIKEVTVYAFSIENFKRSQDEVDTLMSLAREKFAKLMEEKDKLTEKGVKIRVIGNLKLLPADLQKSIADAMLLTKDNDKSTLNVAFAYTSRDEITNSIATLVKGVEKKELTTDDLKHFLIDECLYTSKCRDVDLLVRTSGEMRFSDFLLWQVKPPCSTSPIRCSRNKNYFQTPATVFYFTKALWPEFTLWHLLAAVFCYQRSCFQTSLIKRHFHHKSQSITNGERVATFLSKMEAQRFEELAKMQSL